MKNKGIDGFEELNARSLLKDEGHFRFSSPKHEQQRNLTIVAPAKIAEQYKELTKWEKLFVANFYQGGDRPQPTDKKKYEKIRAAIEKELDRLYALAEDKTYFRIEIKDNKSLDRHFESELKALEARGEKQTADYYRGREREAKIEMAKELAKTQQAEYKHIVDFIKSTSYEPAFKALMLRETLLKTYRRVEQEGDKKTVVDKRIPHKTLDGHMTLNADVLNVIYNDLDSFETFAPLYFAGIAVSNKTTSEKNKVTLSGLDTFGKGIWLKFEGQQSNKKEYLKNAKNLAALVKGTPWCTKELAPEQLKHGDFFVFVDNDEKPHIAVKMSGNTVDEVRGTKNGNAQELEEEYRDVAIEFLTKNPEVKDGEKWLKKEEWNKRLIMWNKKIEDGTLQETDVEQMLTDIYDKTSEYKLHGQENSNLLSLKKNLKKASKDMAGYFKCREEQIAFNRVSFWKKKECEYVAILATADFECSKMTSLGDLQIICGDADFRNSSITSSGALQTIVGNAYFNDAQIGSLENLQTIVGNAYFNDAKIGSLGNLRSIGGSAYFVDSEVMSLGNLESIGGDADFTNSKITTLGNLKTIGGTVKFKRSQITSLGNLQEIGGDVDFGIPEISDFGELRRIGGNVTFAYHCALEVKFMREFRPLKGGGWERLPEYLKDNGTEKKKEKDLKL